MLRNRITTRSEKKKSRARRTRARLDTGTKPRLSVFVSNTHIYAQIIDDKNGKTLTSASDKDINLRGKNNDIAQKVGEVIGQKAKEHKIKEVIFDRGAKPYHGRIKALAEGARKELKF